jgi:hypothetical protein
MIKKIGVLSGVLTAGAIAVAAAVPASASQVGPAGVTRPATSAKPAPGPSGSQTQYTQGAPGYGATNSSGFEQATETTTLVRDTNVFSSSYQPFVTLENSTSSTLTPEVELIPTATSSSAPVDSWYPNGDAGSANPTSFFWIQPTPYPANSPCSGKTDPRGCFYVGETVTLTVDYNTSSGTAYMTIADHDNGDEYLASLPYSTATSGALTTAHLGDVWLAAYDGQTFTAPRHPEDLNSFTSVTLTDTSGHTRPLGDWTHFERIMTSDGTVKGNTEITPGPLSFDGKSFGLTVK